jgi:hypothetical protein
VPWTSISQPSISSPNAPIGSRYETAASAIATSTGSSVSSVSSSESMSLRTWLSPESFASTVPLPSPMSSMRRANA